MKQHTLLHFPISEKRKNVHVKTKLPIVFLAGPIRNAPKWQEKAIDIFIELNKELFVACPTRRMRPDQKLFLVPDNDNYVVFPRQRAWEQEYLFRSAKKGCIIFWLPKEGIKEDPDKVYAHITMMELGQWMVRCNYNKNISMVIGTDGDFPEWSTIKFELESLIPHVQIFYTLQETVEAAVQLATKQKLAT